MAEAVLFVTKNGLGKVCVETEFPTKNRGGKGVGGFKLQEGDAIACIEHVKTEKKQRILVVTAQGQCLMTNVDDIPLRSRTAGGVKLLNVADDDAVVAVLV